MSEGDVHRWESTERGPEKLVAVLTHAKYRTELRTEAALSLVRMKPRAGRRVGIDHLTVALASLADDERAEITTLMAPELITQIKAPPPKRGPDGALPQDASIPYKDAAFAMLSHAPPLVSNPKVAAELTSVLTLWVQADFENRIENGSQLFGIEQMMRFLKAPAVRGLPALINADSLKVDRIAALVADLGDDETKAQAGQALVRLAKFIESDDWVKKATAIVKESNARLKATPTDEQFAAQMGKFRDQELLKAFSAMKRVGGRPVVDFCLDYAGEKDKTEDRRKAALAAIEGRFDKTNARDIDRLFAVSRDEATPDGVRDLAFARLGELPKEQVVPKLYTLFDAKRWKVRWVAGSVVLKTLTTRELPEFFKRLPEKAAPHMAMGEFITYGSYIAKMEPKGADPKPRDVIQPYLQAKDVAQKLTAIGFFYAGKKADFVAIRGLADDRTLLPKCDPSDDCGWACEVAGKTPEAPRENKVIATVGEFVSLCVEPSMVAP